MGMKTVVRWCGEEIINLTRQLWVFSLQRFDIEGYLFLGNHPKEICVDFGEWM